jgi:hypothetical protein
VASTDLISLKALVRGGPIDESEITVEFTDARKLVRSHFEGRHSGFLK